MNHLFDCCIEGGWKVESSHDATEARIEVVRAVLGQDVVFGDSLGNMAIEDESSS